MKARFFKSSIVLTLLPTINVVRFRTGFTNIEFGWLWFWINIIYEH